MMQTPPPFLEFERSVLNILKLFDAIILSKIVSFNQVSHRHVKSILAFDITKFSSDILLYKLRTFEYNIFSFSVWLTAMELSLGDAGISKSEILFV